MDDRRGTQGVRLWGGGMSQEVLAPFPQVPVMKDGSGREEKRDVEGGS